MSGARELATAVERIVAQARAEAWHEGWIAGCDDQQYGDEDAQPWTPNPYAATEDGHRP